MYSAARPVETQAKSALRKVLDTFYHGSVSGAVAALLTDQLSRDEILELENLIEAAKEEKK